MPLGKNPKKLSSKMTLGLELSTHPQSSASVKGSNRQARKVQSRGETRENSTGMRAAPAWTTYAQLHTGMCVGSYTRPDLDADLTTTLQV